MPAPVISETTVPARVRRSHVVFYLSVRRADGAGPVIYVSRSRERLRALWRRTVSALPWVAPDLSPWLDWVGAERAPGGGGRIIYPRAAITSDRAAEILDPEGLLT